MKNVGIGTRVLNALIDTVLIFILSIVGFNVWNWYVKYYDVPPLNFWIIFAIILFVYYTLLELAFGRTIGKFTSYSKVVNLNGKKANILQILVRSVIRLTLIDAFFFPFFNEKTLHDVLSKTQVVEV